MVLLLCTKSIVTKKLEKFEDICKACALEYLADRKKEEKERNYKKDALEKM